MRIVSFLFGFIFIDSREGEVGVGERCGSLSGAITEYLAMLVCFEEQRYITIVAFLGNDM